MAQSELVLDFEGEAAEEIRLTDQCVQVGDRIEVGAEDWIVVRELARSQRAHARFQCRRSEAQSQRATEMQNALEDLKRRSDEQRGRITRSRKDN